MNRRPVVMLMVLVGLAVLVASANAGANPGRARLLPFKPCNHVLAPGDFEDNLAEVSPSKTLVGNGLTAEISVCKYASTEEAAGGLEKTFTKGELGGECLAHGLLVDKEAAEKGEEAHLPPSGCYRLVTVSVLYAHGKPVAKLLAQMLKGERSKPWPPGYGRYLAHGVGDRSEFGYNDAGDGYGYVQLDNASVIVETSERVVLLTVLKNAAATL